MGSGKVTVKCKKCSGTGYIKLKHHKGKIACDACGGTGTITEVCLRCANSAKKGYLPCARCGGTGKEVCDLCNGTGQKCWKPTMMEELQMKRRARAASGQ
jgi:DnaJ-class molecular chaperone